MKNKKSNIDFDEFAPDVFSGASNLDYIERPISTRIFILIGIVLLIGILIIFGKIFSLNVVKGDFYQQRAMANVNRERSIPAYRGVITDRFGEVLAESSDTFSVFADATDLIKEGVDLEDLLSKVAEATGQELEGLMDKVAETDLEKSNEIVLVRNIEPEVAINIRAQDLGGVRVENDYRREYTDGPIFSQIIGYTGASEEGNLIVGKAGLERFYDKELRGKEGVYTYTRNAIGEVLDERVSLEAISGSKMATTLDAGLQKYFYKRLKSQLADMGSRAGVGIAIDPATGEILALVSLPSYDNNAFVTPGRSEEITGYFNNDLKPLFNRAIMGSYSPGSTIKPLVALAALREKVVDPVYGIYSPGYLDVPNPYDPDKPTRFLDWQPQGWVNVRSALAKSSNVYFYQVGGGFGDLVGLGIERLKNYWRMFGLGGETGVDFVGEATGFLPDPEWKEEKTDQPWRIGDTYNVSIGQGDLQVSPLQLIRFIASIADGGHMRRPHFVKELTASDGTKTVARWQDVFFDYSGWVMELEEVRAGMAQGVSKSYGTSHMLATLPMSVAGKTGSAQISNNTKTNAFFVGYGPVEPIADLLPEKVGQIAVLVLIEDAKEGSLNAVPVARDVLNWYYFNRLSD